MSKSGPVYPRKSVCALPTQGFGKKTGVATPVHDAIYAELLPLEQRARGLA